MSIARRSLVVVTAAAAVVTLVPTSAQAAPAPRPFTPALGTVTSVTLNQRLQPTTRASRVGLLHRGDVVSPVCARSGQLVAGTRTWYWAQGVHSGWVSARYVKLTQGRVPACSTFGDMKLVNARISNASQVRTQLAGTSPSFRAFIAAEVTAAQKLAAKDHCRVVVNVDAWWNNDQAIGGVGGCGGYAALWTYRNGAWHELGTQDILPCATLRKAGARHVINGNTGWTCTVPPARRGQTPVIVQYSPRG